MIDQASMMRAYNDQFKEKFNPDLFVKDDNAIIEELKKVILSCQRNRAFTIKVVNFTVVEDYDEIYKILYNYEKNKLKSGDENRYDFISLKDSEVKLLVVDYFLKVYNEDDPKKSQKNLRVIIEVPRVVDKYYYKIFGNLYTTTYQVIESTYNNSSSASSKSSGMVALKTMFMASRFYRFNIENSKEINLVNTEGEKMVGVYYQSNIFKKFVLAMKYLLARYGFYTTRDILKTPNLYISDIDPRDPDMYTCKVHKIYVSAPKYLYDRDETLQSLFYTVCVSVVKNTTVDEMYTREFWLRTLGHSFSSTSDGVKKGLSILESLESIYDLAFKEHLHLPDEHKRNIYDIIIWIMREFPALRAKDNLDISMKRIRDAEYIALLYAMKISSGIYRISDKGNKVTIQSIEKAINTYPDFLLKAMARDSLINFRGYVNDLDAVSALKYTYKGVSGLGEGGTSIPKQYRQVHKSHIGRVDLDAVSATDPGLTGMICPMTTIYNGSFSNEEEPDTWREEVDNLLKEYREMIGVKDILELKRDLVGSLVEEDTYRYEAICENMERNNDIIPGVCNVEQSKPDLIPLVFVDDTSK